MQTRMLGTLPVSAIGLGCMGMSFAYGPADEAASLRTLHRAVELGVTLFDTAEVYGPFTNEALLGRALRSVRSRVVLATKFGFRIGERGQGVERIQGVNSRPEHVRTVVEASLVRLGVDTIDLLYQHRVDPAVPTEDVVGTMADLVRQGKVRHLGLSEVSADTLRRAHAVHPISAVQSEYSLWSRDPEQGLLAACRELGVGLVAYSPLGRGQLAGVDGATLATDDFRRTQPRFQAEHLAVNQHLALQFKALADARGCSPAQLALAWLLARGDEVVPIPGSRHVAHLEDNLGAAAIRLSAGELTAIDEALPPSRVSGARYDEASLRMVNL